jgi:hypothetical protein
MPDATMFNRIRRAHRCVALLLALPVGGALRGQAPDAAAAGHDHTWLRFGAGFVSSILVHEAAHVTASLVMHRTPTFGFDKGRPTIYSGIVAADEPTKQFIFSAAGMTAQSALDEGILDVPHRGGGAFERGVLCSGIATVVFYGTLGRNASVSDVTLMARTSNLSKTEVSLIFGAVAAMHAVRISRSGMYAHFFARPMRPQAGPPGRPPIARMALGVTLRPTS